MCFACSGQVCCPAVARRAASGSLRAMASASSPEPDVSSSDADEAPDLKRARGEEPWPFERTKQLQLQQAAGAPHESATHEGLVEGKDEASGHRLLADEQREVASYTAPLSHTQ